MICELLCATIINGAMYGGTMQPDGQCGTPTHTVSSIAWRPWNGDPAYSDLQEIEAGNSLGKRWPAQIKICADGKFCVTRTVPEWPHFISFEPPHSVCKPGEPVS